MWSRRDKDGQWKIVGVERQIPMNGAEVANSNVPDPRHAQFPMILLTNQLARHSNGETIPLLDGCGA